MIIASATCCAIVIIYGRSDHVFFHIGTGIYVACGAGLGEFSTLTVALFFGTLVPKRSISPISSRVVMVSKNCSQGFPLKFQGASFGTIKKFWGRFLNGSLTGS